MKVDGNDGEIEWTSDKDESNKLFWISFRVLLTMEMMDEIVRDILFSEGVKMVV